MMSYGGGSLLVLLQAVKHSDLRRYGDISMFPLIVPFIMYQPNNMAYIKLS